MGLFIAFEGGEGSGKSTQAASLYHHLFKLGIPSILTHEPGGTALGEKIRLLLKQPSVGIAKKGTQIPPSHICKKAELFLFLASRAQLVSEVISLALEEGRVVICDRYSSSTLAYQGYGRGLELDVIEQGNTLAVQKTLPNLMILLDIPVESGLARKGMVNLDRFEKEELDFHRRVLKGYRVMAAAEPSHWLVVDATLPRKEVEQLIWQRVEPLFLDRQVIRNQEKGIF